LVEMHNGTLCAESEGRGQGSRFIVRLPLTDIPSKAAPAERSERAVHVGDYKVLVVDDNGDVAKMLGMLVKQLGVGSTLTASSGLEALDLGAKVQPDILLLDLGMPDMDGFEVARRVRRAPWGDRLTLVAVTGW